LVTLYVVFGILVILGTGLAIYAYRIYKEDKKLGIKEFRKRQKDKAAAP